MAFAAGVTSWRTAIGIAVGLLATALLVCESLPLLRLGRERALLGGALGLGLAASIGLLVGFELADVDLYGGGTFWIGSWVGIVLAVLLVLASVGAAARPPARAARPGVARRAPRGRRRPRVRKHVHAVGRRSSRRRWPEHRRLGRPGNDVGRLRPRGTLGARCRGASPPGAPADPSRHDRPGRPHRDLRSAQRDLPRAPAREVRRPRARCLARDSPPALRWSSARCCARENLD